MPGHATPNNPIGNQIGRNKDFLIAYFGFTCIFTE